MADKERVEPTLNDLPAPDAEVSGPKITEPTIESVVDKVEALESAGSKPNEFDGSEGDMAYQAKVQEVLSAAYNQIQKNDRDGQELLSISRRAIKPDEGTQYESFGEPLDLDVAADMRLAQVALQDEETAKKFFDKFVERVGKKNAATITPLTMGNVPLLLTPENIKDVKEVAPQYFTESYTQKLVDNGKDLLEKAGFSQQVIDRLDNNFLRYMAATEVHEAAFPVEGPVLHDRLKDPSAKEMVLDALANKNVQRSLKWAGLIVSCATGGIVVKAGMTGAKFLAGKLVENESVRAFALKLEDRSISFVSEKFGLDEAKIRKKVENVKGSVESAFKNKWVALATGVAVVGVAVALGHIDAVHDIAQDVAGRFHELPYSVVSGVAPGWEKGLELTMPSDLVEHLKAPAVPEGLVAQAAAPVVPEGLAANAAAPVVPEGVAGNTPAAVSPEGLAANGAAPAAMATPGGELSVERSGVQSGIAPEVRFPGAPELATAAPAGASDVHFPDAPGASSGGASVAPAVADSASAPAVGNTSHVVQAKDTVSQIAERELQARGIPATGENIYKLVDQIHEHNRAVIGPDINKIFPGQTISLNFEPQNLNLGHHASVAVSAPVPPALEVSASRIIDAPSNVAPISVLGVNKEQMLAATSLDALNPMPKIEESAQLAAGLRVDPHTAIVSVPAPTKPIVPNIAFAGSSSVAQHADVDQVMQDYLAEEKLRDLADAEDKVPKRWHHPLENDGLSKG